MPENTPAFDPSIQSENIAFNRDEMIVCNGCSRANPPNRSNCIYCAHELEVSLSDVAAMKTMTGRRLETWERGFNVILVKRTDTDADIGRAADLVRFESDSLSKIVASETALPVARVESEQEAGVISERLEQFGFACSLISDEDLGIDKPHVRLSGVEFAQDTLVVVSFNTKERFEIAFSDLVLIVKGVLTKGRVDSLEKKQRRGKTKLIDETATSSDEQVFDLYTRDDPTGFRVHQAGFDFAFLGESKGLLAVENMRVLIGELKRRAANAKYVDNYGQVRRLLDDVWETETRKDFHGLQRSGFGKVEFGSSASTSNLTQFNKFSRLQYHLR